MRRPYHVVVLWPDGRGPRDPTLVELERARFAEMVDALAAIPGDLLSELGPSRYRVEPVDEEDAWRDLRDVASPSLEWRDCIDEDVVREVLRSDVAAARAICRRHLLDDPGLSDEWIVAHLTDYVTGSFATRELLADYHALAVRVLPVLIRAAGG